MSTEVIGGVQAPLGVDSPASPELLAACDSDSCPDAVKKDQTEPAAKHSPPVFLHSPPDSNNAAKSDGTDSELSDLEDEPVLDDATLHSMQTKPQDGVAPEQKDASQADAETAPQEASNGDQTQQQEPKPEEPQEEDIGEVLPDHWSGGVPVFMPTMHQFNDFNRFMKKVDSYGMKSGIIKVIPPAEWKNSLPELDDLVKQIRVREPIKQDIMGSNGTYRQVNILHGRSYNVPQWRQLCEQSEHQPPARRGERRANADKPKIARARAAAAAKSRDPAAPKKRGPGRPARGRGKKTQKADEGERPMTPVSPRPDAEGEKQEDKPVDSIEEPSEGAQDTQDAELAKKPSGGRMGGSRQARPKTQSTSARRKYSRREGSAMIDEAAFKDFDYRMDISEYTPQRCEELERAYWKTLTYAPPLYGADLMGTLFDESTPNWNLNKLPNLLDVLGTQVPGVNTAYLYLGMWKATFAWHLEDVDLYSINYLHFGAPKQWYSIPQADARRFEAAMKSIWPADAKACDQFLRHKAFLISPQHLLQHYGVKVNKVVSYPGEFVVTYPYGYHSGYNLGYNCAEAVNFALDSWLDMGKIAKKCDCAQAQDSVWINVYEIERKLRGEETEYEETEEEEDYDDDDDLTGLPTPPASHGVKFKDGRKRKRGPADKGKLRVKKIKLRLKAKAEPPCCLCPNDVAGLEILPTDDGRKAHRLCALYLPETYIDTIDGKELVSNVASIHKDRLALKCLFCRSKRGACFQCSQHKCARSYHPTCAAAAGVFVEEGDVPVFGEDGTEYKEQAFEYSCRYHRTKRDKKLDGEALEDDSRIMAAAADLQAGQICQFQYYRGEIFAGRVIENRPAEQTVLVDIVPKSDHVEVAWKWLLLADPSDYHLPKASAKAIPMPASQKAKDKLGAKRNEDRPRKDDVFAEGLTWAEFNLHELERSGQAKVDLEKENQLWHYIAKGSTDAKDQYTEDPSRRQHNPKSNYLDTIPKEPKPQKPKPAPKPRHSVPSGLYHTGTFDLTGPAKPYAYKPRASLDASRMQPGQPMSQTFSRDMTPVSRQMPQQYYAQQGPPPSHNGQFATQTFQVKPGQWWPMPRTNFMPQPKPAAPPQQNQASWSIHQPTYQKYEFFEYNHNRDASTYQTPYKTYGGFTNGYEVKHAPESAQHYQPPGQSNRDPQHQLWQNQNGHAPAEALPVAQPMGTPPIGKFDMPTPRPTSLPKAPKAPKPAIKKEALSTPRPTPSAPAKQTPVPLPPYIQAAMASSQSANAPRALSRAAQVPKEEPSSESRSPSTSQTSDSAHHVVSESSIASSPRAKVSTTPVPIPNLPGMGQVPQRPRTPHMAMQELMKQQQRLASAGVTGQAALDTIQQDFPDVPGSESMEFVERMMENLRRASVQGAQGGI